MRPLENRSLAIDVLRGMTLALMIVVNMSFGDASYGPLMHAQWNGFTLTDLVFPTFLFVVGLSQSRSLARYEAQGRAVLLGKALRRTALIFLCGYLLYWYPFIDLGKPGWELLPISGTRILGVLQRIALGYFFAVLVLHFLRDRGAIVFSVLALAGYWAILSWCGDLTLAGNAVLKLDRAVLGEDHLWRGEGIPFDPEGILSTLPAIVNVIVGYFAGKLLQQKGPCWESIARLMLAGAVLVVAALTWGCWFPVNKKLWTSTFVLLTVGIDCAVLGVLVYALDLRNWRLGARFFEVFGRNTLVLYLVSEVFQTNLWITHVNGKPTSLWLFEDVFAPTFGRPNGALFYALLFMLCCWAVGWVMDRRGIYVRM